MMLQSAKFCAVVAARPEQAPTGDAIWIVTHACGKTERRLRRKRGSAQMERRAPKRVACVKGG